MISKLPALIALSLLTLTSTGCQTLQWVGGHLFTKSNPPSSPLPLAVGGSNAAPSSTRPYSEVLDRARKLIEGDPALRIGQVAATGSMRPYLGESALVIMEKTSTERLKPGSLITFTRGGAEFIHILVSLTPEGAVAKGSNPDTEELVPYASITGSNIATLYFDPSTAPRDRSGPPLFLAASDNQIPSSAGTLRIIEAAMITGTKSALVYPGKPGEYTVSLQPSDTLGLTLGVPGAGSVPTAETQIAWAESVAGKTVRFQIYHPDAPETGVILVDATFLR
jgi:hypothetical protein